MFKVRISAAGLLALCLSGCGEWAGESPKARTGAVGVTAEGIDDLAKPAAQPTDGKAGGKSTYDVGP